MKNITFAIGAIVLSSILLLLFLVIVNNAFKIGLTEEIIVDITGSALIVICFLLISPTLRKEMKRMFILDKNIHKIIPYPILLAFLSAIVINASRLIPLIFGRTELIGIGANQFSADNISLSVVILYLGIFTGFFEEFLFRFLPYATVLLLCTKEYNKNNKWLNKLYTNFFIEKDKRLEWAWIIFIAVLFSLAHMPDLTNFHFYFIPGVVFGWLFFRFGLLAAWIAHASFNIFSGPTLYIVIYIWNKFASFWI